MGCCVANARCYLGADETRRALTDLLKRRGAKCADEDVIVATTETRRGDPVHVVFALNSAERPLANLVKCIAARRNARVGAPGVFVLRPDDVEQLINKEPT